MNACTTTPTIENWATPASALPLDAGAMLALEEERGWVLLRLVGCVAVAVVLLALAARLMA